jgi:hypothetical protein
LAIDYFGHGHVIEMESGLIKHHPETRTRDQKLALNFVTTCESAVRFFGFSALGQEPWNWTLTM